MIEETYRVANAVTHVLGLDAVAETTLNQPEIGGGKKLVYTHKQADLTKLSDVSADSELGRILAKTDGIWSQAAENYVLKNYPEIKKNIVECINSTMFFTIKKE
ncbi:hypothetical protein [Enterococcus viikkiensis]|nr:hypothetical protein [Enterococcus viikkiensis]